MEVARLVSSWSKDPSTKIGAVIISPDGLIRSTGYNGFPRGIDDDFRLEVREMKYPRVIHAEMNAILQAGRDCDQATLYMWGMAGPPCMNCVKHLIQAGVYRVVAAGPPVQDRWKDELQLSIETLDEAGVQFSIIDIDE